MGGYTIWTKHDEEPVMDEGNNVHVGEMPNPDQSRMGVEFILGAKMSSYRQKTGMPKKPKKNQECEAENTELDDMPDFAAMIADFHGPDTEIAGYKELPSIDAASKKDLYPGCKKKYSKLSATLALLRFKAENGLSNKGFTELLGLFKDILPKDNVLPKSTNEAKKVVCPLELEVQKIHACVNDCMLYRGDYKDLRSCRICKHARYKRRRAKDKYKMDEEIEIGIPFKVVWYLPIIPRLKRLFANPREAKRLRWHHDERTADKYMRHPKDGAQWE